MTLLPLAFLGVGDQEMLVIMVVVLILFGGKKMPDFARGLGKALKELRKATGEVEREFKRVMDEAENPPKPPLPNPYTPIAPALSIVPAAPASPQPEPAADVAGAHFESPQDGNHAPEPLDEPPPHSPPDEGSEFHSDI
jgi:sec-independent protein translocase protein TatA